jgi:hypothetical protein
MVIGMDVAFPEVFSKKEKTHEVFSKINTIIAPE